MTILDIVIMLDKVKNLNKDMVQLRVGTKEKLKTTLRISKIELIKSKPSITLGNQKNIYKNETHTNI